MLWHGGAGPTGKKAGATGRCDDKCRRHFSWWRRPSRTAKAKTRGAINGVYDYLFVLLEQLRYTLFNLDGSNINQNALSEFIKNISEPIYAKIEDTDKNVNEISITAKGLDARLSDAEGDITQLDTTAKGLQASISNLDGAITNIKADVNGIRATVSTKIDATQAQSIFDQSATGFTLGATEPAENRHDLQTQLQRRAGSEHGQH